MSEFHIKLLEDFKSFCFKDMQKDFLPFKLEEKPVSVALCYKWFCVSCNVDKQFARQMLREWERDGLIEYQGNQKIIFKKHEGVRKACA